MRRRARSEQRRWLVAAASRVGRSITNMTGLLRRLRPSFLSKQKCGMPKRGQLGPAPVRSRSRHPDELEHLVPHRDELDHGRRGQLADLLVPRGRGFEKVEQVAE